MQQQIANSLILTINTVRSRQNGAHFVENTSTAFSRKKIYFDSNFINVYSQGPIKHYVCTSSENGYAPSRQQAITWTNVGLVHSCLYVALGLNE